MSELRRAVAQGSLYTLFQGIGMAISLVSFPIITRILTVEEYGHLALFNTTVSILLAGAKCGMTTSVIRAFAAVSDDRDERKRLYTSAFAASLAIAFGVAVIYTVALFFLGDRIGRALTTILLLAGIPIVTGSLRDLFYAFFRAEERVLTLSVTGLVVRVGSIASGILACVVLLGGLTGFVTGVIAFEAVAVVLLGVSFVRRRVFDAALVSPTVARQLLAFGAPLLLFETSSLLNDYADRFLIAYFLDAAQLGIYSVGYNLATYVQTLVTSPLWMSIFPIYTKIWETDGRDKTAAFLGSVLRLYVVAAVMIVLLVSVTGHEIITLLASKKFAAAGDVIPFVIASVMLYGSTHITAAGFYLTRQTRTIALLTIGAAALHALLNLFFIPAWGIIGAAYAAAISYLALTVVVTYRARALLPTAWPLRLTLICLAAAAVAFVPASAAGHGNLLVALALKSAIAGGVYAALVLLLDPALRRSIAGYAKNLVVRARP